MGLTQCCEDTPSAIAPVKSHPTTSAHATTSETAKGVLWQTRPPTERANYLNQGRESKLKSGDLPIVLVSVDDFAKILVNDDDSGVCRADILMERIKSDKQLSNEAINWQTWTNFIGDPVFYDSEQQAYRVSRMLMLGVLLCGGTKE